MMKQMQRIHQNPGDANQLNQINGRRQNQQKQNATPCEVQNDGGDSSSSPNELGRPEYWNDSNDSTKSAQCSKRSTSSNY